MDVTHLMPIPPLRPNTSINPKQPQKKRLKSTHACEYCKKQHRKCDGQYPCKNCIKKGLECVYVARKKRGPRKQKRTTPEQQNIQDMTQMSKKPKLETISPTFDLKNHLYLCVTKFMEKERAYRPLFSKEFEQQLPLLLDKVIRKDKDNYSDPKVFLLYTMLTLGTRCLGDLQRAEEFHECARICAGNLFDSTDYDVGCAFLFLSCSSFIKGEIDKAHSYMDISCRVCHMMGDKESNLKKRQLMFIGLHGPNYETCVKAYKNLGSGEKHTPYDELLSVVGLAWAEMRFKNNPNYFALLSSMDKYVEMIERKDPPADKSFQFFVYGIMTMALHKSGLSKMAAEWADKTTNLAWNTEFCIGFVLTSMDIAAEVHLSQGMWGQFERDLTILERCSRTHPVAQMLYKKYSMLKAQTFLEQARQSIQQRGQQQFKQHKTVGQIENAIPQLDIVLREDSDSTQEKQKIPQPQIPENFQPHFLEFVQQIQQQQQTQQPIQAQQIQQPIQQQQIQQQIIPNNTTTQQQKLSELSSVPSTPKAITELIENTVNDSAQETNPLELDLLALQDQDIGILDDLDYDLVLSKFNFDVN